MKRLAALAALALIAGCHRSEAASDAPDADADLRAKTAAKTLADIAAAEEAAKAPLPRTIEPSPEHVADRPGQGPDPEPKDAVPENSVD